jgi:hypothetical protein
LQDPRGLSRQNNAGRERKCYLQAGRKRETERELCHTMEKTKETEGRAT